MAVRDEGAFGVLKHHLGQEDRQGIPFAVTLERTYDQSDSVVAVPLLGQRIKIPRGLFVCHKSFFHKGGYWTYEIEVPGHTRMLFHRGNLEKHADGCVMVAEQFSMISGRVPGISDGTGLSEMLSRAGGVYQFDLEVV